LRKEARSSTPFACDQKTRAKLCEAPRDTWPESALKITVAQPFRAARAAVGRPKGLRYGAVR
jgi:hypothetical protein